MSECKIDFHTVITGEERDLVFKFKKSDGDPYTLNAPDEIIFKFKKTDKTVMQKKLTLSEVTIVSDPFGHVSVRLNEADTVLLLVGERMDVFAEITKSTVTRKAIFKQVLTVTKDIA